MVKRKIDCSDLGDETKKIGVAPVMGRFRLTGGLGYGRTRSRPLRDLGTGGMINLLGIANHPALLCNVKKSLVRVVGFDRLAR